MEDTKDNQLSCFKSYKSLITDAAKLLNKVTEKKWVDGKQTKLIVLVDEIDRCLPDEQLKILERLHHLFGVKNCAVIVAMNQACVAKTVKTIYGIDGYEYLRKFFDFTFKLEMSSETYLKNLFEGFVSSCEKLQPPANEVSYPVSLAYQCLLYGEKNVIKNVDNRELTRYYESVQNVCNDFGWEKLNQQYVYFILLGLFIRRVISPLFLNSTEMVENQNAKSLELENEDYPERIMPYYDYLFEYLGIDRKNAVATVSCKPIEHVYDNKPKGAALGVFYHALKGRSCVVGSRASLVGIDVYNLYAFIFGKFFAYSYLRLNALFVLALRTEPSINYSRIH